MGRRARLIGAIDRNRRGPRRRRQDGVDAAEGRGEFAHVLLALRQREQVVTRGDGFPELDARSHVRIRRERRIVDQMADEAIALGADDGARGRSVVRQAAGELDAAYRSFTELADRKKRIYDQDLISLIATESAFSAAA